MDCKDCAEKPFQSTPPVKAATRIEEGICQEPSISIHAAREGGDETLHKQLPRHAISIHAAREGGDADNPKILPVPKNFNPRRP